MSKLIALCDGHGMSTPGKRTPILPDGLKSETGNFMHENEFNRAVVKYLDVHLKRCGFKTLLVAPTDDDTSLSSRVNKANNAKADLYLSVHANANTSKWGAWGGIETFVYPSGESKRIGTIIHKHLIGGTKLRDRGVKDGSGLYVISKTSMPSVLVECAFMDNLDEAKLLLSDSYRRECAEEIAKGVCEAYKIKYVEDTKPEPKPAEPEKAPSISTPSQVKDTSFESVGHCTADVWLHSSPDISTASRVRVLEKDSAWKVWGEKDGFYVLGGGGYVSKDYMDLYMGNYVTTTDLWLHSSPDSKEETRLRVLPKGSAWRVYCEVDGFYNLGGSQYASKEYMKKA